MGTNDWLQRIKEGDEVAIYGYDEFTIKPSFFTVEKVQRGTSSAILTESWRCFDRSDGQSHDDDKSFLREYTPELAAKVDEAQRKFSETLASLPMSFFCLPALIG